MGEFQNSKLSSNTFTSDNTSLHAATHSSLDSRSSIINNLVTSKINRIKDNPFTFFNGMSIVEVTFYNINKEYTTLDETLDNTFNFIGPASGLRFDKINGVILYGIGKMELDIDQTEWGPESAPIEGECYLPPNTFRPYQESYFTINHVTQSSNRVLFFRVTGVNQDTFTNGNNYWKINYKLESVDENIDPQVINEYIFLAANIGYGGTLVEAGKYGLYSSIGEAISQLRSFYTEMFFQNSTQTFVFKYGNFDTFFYDPYLIEFMIKNRIFATNDKSYIHVCQPAQPPMYIQMDYNHTVFRFIEDPENTKVCYWKGYGLMVTDPMSLLSVRMEPYYMITVRDDYGDKITGSLLEPIYMFDAELMALIPGYKELFPESCPCGCKELLDKIDPNREYYKIINGFINGEDISIDKIKYLTQICFVPCKELYYTIPILIYILMKYYSGLVQSAQVSSSID